MASFFYSSLLKRDLTAIYQYITATQIISFPTMIHVDDLPYEFRAAAGCTSLTGEEAAAAGRKEDWKTLLREAVVSKLEEGQPNVMDAFARQFEEVLYRAALDFTHGRRVEAAYKLGVGRNTLTRKVQELGISGAK